MKQLQHKDLEVGLGLRPSYYSEMQSPSLQLSKTIPWLEIISENYMGYRGVQGGRPIKLLEGLRKDYGVVMHGVSMSLGSVDALNLNYLKSLKELADRIQPQWISDHLCWTGFASENIHDLLPLPYTEEALTNFCRKLDVAQNYLGREMVIENLSSYVNFNSSEMTEWEFLSELAKRSGCKLLLDVNNVYVSSENHKFDPWEFISHLPKEAIWEIHLAGHSYQEALIVDTHDQPICDPVWNLYKRTLAHLGPRPTLIERDDNMPPFEDLLTEVRRAQDIYQTAVAVEENSRELAV
jgi:uncharacterized protein (UPF0276 family)